MPQLYAAIAHGRIRRVRELLPEVPPDLDEIVARCLSRRRSERYADGAALRDALLAISPPKPISPAKSVNAWHARTLPSVAPSSGSSPQSVSLDPVSSSTDARDRLRRLGLVRAVPIGRLAFGFALVVLLAATLFRRSSPPVPRTAVEAPRSRQQQQERSPASSKLLGGGVQGPLEDTAPVPSARAAESAATRPEKRAIRVPKVNAPGLPSSSPTAMPAGPSATSPASIYDKYP